ncbi:YycH family regulatory protein [Enterococcus cecorum]|uniref:YycH family regulatory protein n=1 Tax=Enterococcus cecorum TaxID=44008 RepID=UPI003F922B7A
MGLKYLSRGIRLCLVALIALSFYLSYLIWLSPERNDESQEQEMSQKITDIRSKEELFLPTSVSYHDDKQINISNSPSILLSLHHFFKDQEIRRLQIYAYENEESLLKNLSKENYVSFDYLSKMNLNEYLSVYQLRLSNNDKQKLKSIYFDEMRLNLKQKQLVFINHEDQQVFKFHVQMDLTQIENYLKKHQKQFQLHEGEFKMVSGQVYSKDPIKLQLYSYISTDQPYTLFRDAFFLNTRDIKVNDDTNDALVLSNHQGDMLSISLNDQMVHFRANQVDFHNQNMYRVSADYVSRLGTNLGQLRFFQREDKKIIYRAFVEGYPLFRKDDNGKIVVSFSDLGQENTRNMEISGNLTTLQVPIPSDKTKTLPGALTICENLQSLGIKALPEMTIGYLWEEIQDTGVVDLTPTWFAYYQNQWLPYDELVQILSNGKGA